mmetsp:Transcript_55426/g.164779  ORF Transcript_55426/g.164779 Transcript_55426/m.164779 type:complete len:369 (+) Transcript_55426:142-1248(+)
MDHAVATVAAVVQADGQLPLPPSTALGGIVVSLSLLRIVIPAVDEGLALVPHHTVFSPVHTWPVPFFWNVATGHFLESHWLKAAVLAPWLVALARMLERLWPARSLAQHLGFTATCSGFMVFLAELVHVYRTRHERDFFVPIRGSVGLLVALSVALRHAYPLEALPLLPRSWGVQCQHLPFGITAVVSTAGLLAPRDTMLEWPFAPLGLFFGWLHLRYVMWFPYAEAHGDHSQDFCFAALFPRPLRPFVSCLSSIVYGLGVLVAPGYVKLRQVDADTGHPIVYDPSKAAEFPTATVNGASMPRPPGPALDPGAAAGAPGSQEYNARRAKALELLDANINSLLAPGAGKLSLSKGAGGAGPSSLEREVV